MPPNETDQSAHHDPEPDWWTRNRHAVTAALGNVTALGLGYVYLRRWTAFGVTLFFTAVLIVIIRRSEPPPPVFWLLVLIALAVATACAGWRDGRRVASQEIKQLRPALRRDPPPLPGRFWVPALLIVLAAYAAGYGWAATDADRLRADQTAAHEDGDCETAIGQVRRLSWHHRAFSQESYDAILAQADTCRRYLRAQGEHYELPEENHRAAIDNLLFYLELPHAVLRGEAEDQIRTHRAELLLLLLTGYDPWPHSEVNYLVGEVQGIVESDPGSPLAEQTLAELAEIEAIWQADLQDDSKVCDLFRVMDILLNPDRPGPQADPIEPGPVADPLLESAAELHLDGAMRCAAVQIELSEEYTESDPDATDVNLERAVEILEIVVDEYPDDERAAEAAALLEALQG